MVTLTLWSDPGSGYERSGTDATRGHQQFMKAFLLIILSVISAHAGGLMTFSYGVPPSVSPTANPDTVPDGLLSWFVRHWEADGYDVPANDKPFNWSDYVTFIVNKPAQENDMIEWIGEGGKPNFGMVIEQYIGADAIPGAIDHRGILVSRPISNVFNEMLSVDTKNVVGYLRPHKKGQKPI